MTDEILNILFDGTKEQMEQYRCPDCGQPVRYDYGERHGSIRAECGCSGVRSSGRGYPPNCFTHFGSKHAF